MSKNDQYVEKAKAQLDQWNAEIAKMEAKVREVEADSKIEYEKYLGELRTKRDDAQQKLHDLGQAGDDAWDDMKDGFEKAWDALSSSFENARARFK